MVVFRIIVSVAVFLFGSWLVKLLDQEFASASGRNKPAMAAALAGLAVAVVMETDGNIVSSFFWSSLFLAAYCDFCTTEIYDFAYLPAATAGVARLLINRDTIAAAVIVELVIFILLQIVLFRHFYGFSDCIAFSVCGIWMASFGSSLVDYFILMNVAFVLLIIVQAFKRNIAKWTLKHPVAFIPYITVAMWFYTLIRR